MKKILAAPLIFSLFTHIHSADHMASNAQLFLKNLPEPPPELYDKIKGLSQKERNDIKSGQGVHRFESPRHTYKVEKDNTKPGKKFSICCSNEQSRSKNRKAVQNKNDHTYVTASMAAHYLKICEVIKQYGLSKVRAEETYLILLDPDNPSYDDTNCVIMQEVSTSVRIASKKDLDLKELLPTFLTLIEHADIWHPEKAFKVLQGDQGLEPCVSACMLPGSYGNFWNMARDREELFVTGCENLCNYFNLRDEPELVETIRQFKEKHNKRSKLKNISSLPSITSKGSLDPV